MWRNLVGVNLTGSWPDLLHSTSNWVEDHRQHFCIQNTPCRTRQIDLLKPLGELALSCGVVLHSQDKKLHSRITTLLEWCWSELTDGNFLAGVIRDHPELIVLSSIYATFYEIGFRCQSVEDEIRFAFSMAGIKAIEFPAWRRLDVLTALSKLNVEHCEDISAVVDRTWLGARPEPWMLSDGAAYSVTHTVFYVTDFGRLPRALSSSYSEYLRRWVPVWLRYYSHTDNLDLLSEFIMVQGCLEQDTMESWCELLSARQSSSGAIPGPKHGGQLLMVGENDAERKVFFEDYHTTLVTMMASAMSIRRIA